MPHENQTPVINLGKTWKSLDFNRIVKQILDIQDELNLSCWTEKDYLEELTSKHSIFLAAGIETEVRGFMLIRLTGEYKTKNLDSKYEQADMLNFGVVKRFQKRGIGNQIYAETLELLTANEVKSLWLEVRESNLDGIEFYRKRNFQMMYRRKNFYSHPTENALVLSLKL